ncbi:DUF1212 domain containing protein [Dokdonella koreensis DS-123]|uniref:DUF1212 domain containing protein n=2 Tax=Dokdonella TaxID=323413 RepID=A0A160DWR9_9GAMM|nr:DUF1212 domain containing protein [Dokdonella koreensis DS-123]
MYRNGLMPAEAALTTRIEFVVELARRLHEYGTAAPRLEDAINHVAARLGLDCNILSTPTSIVMSFSDRQRPGSLADVTQVVRLSPGEVNLERLCEVDEIADRVIDGQVDLVEGRRRLRDIGALRPSLPANLLLVAAYGVASACVAIILRTAWPAVATAGLIGLATGAIALGAASRPNIAAAFEAICALLATLVATAIAVYLVPIDVRAVVIASLIVLLPGLSLTTAVRELSSQHLISGTARMAGAMAILLKLAFGAVAATQLGALFGWMPPPMPAASVPVWAEWAAVVAAGLAFAAMFRSPGRYYPVVIAAVVLGYVCTRVGGIFVSAPFGVFLGGLMLGAASNVFARVWKRPGALLREPGIILLVPGSVGFRTLSFVLERDVMLGLDTAVTLLTLLIALVAGLLFGDLLVPPRRKL